MNLYKTGMEALLGPAAAKMWRQRTFGHRNRRVSHESSTSQSQTVSTSGSDIRRASSMVSSQRSSNTGMDLKIASASTSHRITDESGSSFPQASMTAPTSQEAECSR